MTTNKRGLYWLLVFISLTGSLLIIHGIYEMIFVGRKGDYISLLELAMIYLCLIPWTIRLPSGASWRPGVPLLMMSIFMIPPSFTVLVSIPGLILITARAHAKWWKYIETFSHIAIGLFCGGHVYIYLLHHLHNPLVAEPIAMSSALITHLVVNRFISAVIVSHREKRTLLSQIKFTIEELHWGYGTSYLLILLVSMVVTHYRPFAILLVTVIQIGVFLAVGHYSHLENLKKSLWKDGLTNIENRNAWEELVKKVNNHAITATIAVIDVNHFKQINDKFGHAIGDEILRDIASSITHQIEKTDRLFRFGGDEFVVYRSLPSDNNISQQIQTAQVNVNEQWKSRGIPSSLSVGVAHSPADSTQLTDLFRIADARMYDEKQSQRMAITGMEVDLPESVHSLILAIESRDKYTAGHNLRVAFYSLKLAQQMGLESQKLDAIFRGGLVHDVGKIGIPDSILNKPAKLTEEEMEIIKHHPEVGFEMCSNLNFTKDELDIIRFHHERYDGTGYPHQLKGNEIPTVATIATVADVYDALTSSRSYRDAWSHEQAMQFIIDNTGTIFETRCVRAWQDVNSGVPLTQQYKEWVGGKSLAGVTRAM